MDDLQEDAVATSQTGADVHYQRLFNWRLKERSGEERWLQRPPGP